MLLNWDLISGAVVLGIFTGGIYALMASGLTLTFGVMDVINVAQGALVILGAYLSYAVEQHLHIDIFLSLLITMPAMFLIGMLLEVAFIRPLKHERTVFSILVTFAIALVIEGILGKILRPTSSSLGPTPGMSTSPSRSAAPTSGTSICLALCSLPSCSLGSTCCSTERALASPFGPRLRTAPPLS